MKIRKAIYKDAKTLTRIQILGWQTAYAHIFPPAKLAALSQEAWQPLWEERLKNPLSQILIAEEEDVALGFIGFGPYRNGDIFEMNQGEIYAIYLDPLHKGKGCGKALCDQACESFKEDSITQVMVWTLEKNHAAQGFYEAIGFEKTSVVKSVELLDTPLDEIQYQKILFS